MTRTATIAAAFVLLALDAGAQTNWREWVVQRATLCQNDPAACELEQRQDTNNLFDGLIYEKQKTDDLGNRLNTACDALTRTASDVATWLLREAEEGRMHGGALLDTMNSANAAARSACLD